jgi:hypothetical protein
MSATDPPAGYTIRPATLDDGPAIADLQNETNLAEVGSVWTSLDEIPWNILRGCGTSAARLEPAR